MRNIIYILIILLISACKNTSNVLYDKSFDEARDIAENRGVSYCIILLDSVRYNLQQSTNNFQKIKANSNVVAYVNIDEDDNRWVEKLFHPTILPFSCIFFNDKLIDLIPGDTDESIAYINLSMKNKRMIPNYHFNQLYDKDKAMFIKQCNQMLILRDGVNRGKNMLSYIDDTMTCLKHPYMIYLKLKNQELMNDVENAKETARLLLFLSSPDDVVLYNEEMFYANHFINSAYNEITAPHLALSPGVVEFNCKVGETKTILLQAKNSGSYPLKIYDVSLVSNKI